MSNKNIGDLNPSIANIIADLYLFLEVDFGQNGRAMELPMVEKSQMLIFFKLYDPDKKEIRYVGRLFVMKSDLPTTILPQLRKLAEYAPDETISLYEEIVAHLELNCVLVDLEKSFEENKLKMGSIVCFQKTSVMVDDTDGSPRDIQSFLRFVFHHRVFTIRKLEEPNDVGIKIEMSRLSTYDEVVKKVAHEIGLHNLCLLASRARFNYDEMMEETDNIEVDPKLIRLTPHNFFSKKPRYSHPFGYNFGGCLHDMLLHDFKELDKIYYEVLPIPLCVFEASKNLDVAYNDALKDEVNVHTISLPKQSTVGDVFEKLKARVEISHPHSELRMLQIINHKIHNVFLRNESFENIVTEYFTFLAEEIPEEEKCLGPSDHLIQVYHFAEDSRDRQELFGDPFFFVIHKGDTLAQVKEKIKIKLKVPDDNFAEWKFAFVELGDRPKYLRDFHIVSPYFKKGKDIYSGRVECGAWVQYLGLEHTNDTRKDASSSTSKKTSAKMKTDRRKVNTSARRMTDGRNKIIYPMTMTDDDVKITSDEMMIDGSKKITSVEIGDIQTSRDERCFRLWINSLGIATFVHNVFEDVKNGWVLLEVLDKVSPGSVNWKQATKPPTKTPFQEVENCNQVIKIGKGLNFSLVNVAGIDIVQGNKKLLLAFMWQIMRFNILQPLKKLISHSQGKDIKDADILNWANNKVKRAGRTSQIESFKDKNLSSGIFFLELMSAVEPRVVNWTFVTKGETDEDKKLNASYIIRIAPELGCSIFLLPEYIIEVNQKMMLFLTASIMYWSLQQPEENTTSEASPVDADATTNETNEANEQSN